MSHYGWTIGRYDTNECNSVITVSIKNKITQWKYKNFIICVGEEEPVQGANQIMCWQEACWRQRNITQR